MTGAVIDPPECTDCGVCCFNALPEAVRVWGGDHARMGDLADAYTQFIGHRCYMKIEDGRCAALVIDPAGRFTCAIYDVRPQVCRDLGRGSSACDAERFEKAHRVRRHLRVLRGE